MWGRNKGSASSPGQKMSPQQRHSAVVWVSVTRASSCFLALLQLGASVRMFPPQRATAPRASTEAGPPKRCLPGLLLQTLPVLTEDSVKARGTAYTGFLGEGQESWVEPYCLASSSINKTNSPKQSFSGLQQSLSQCWLYPLLDVPAASERERNSECGKTSTAFTFRSNRNTCRWWTDCLKSQLNNFVSILTTVDKPAAPDFKTYVIFPLLHHFH
ncbi:uncharacterized protein LOC133139511 [Conger conger]|uniref:uncharacterized protein LOC133139511 n=1 Tax=Conger conger TaxID=82655 RepID=UPI002A5AD6E2|nr:uncharacterized protein LOC133139511 [Conger conger]